MLLLVTYGDRDVKKTIFVFVGCLLLSACDKKPEAPFGFEWGQTIEDVKDKKLTSFKADEDMKFMQFASAKSAPKNAYDAESYSLAFLPVSGLSIITMYSKGLDSRTQEPIQAKKLYEKISGMLQEKYGNPLEINEHVNRDGAEFYDCLTNESCGQWKRQYKKEGVSVILEISALGGYLLKSANLEKGRVTVSYTYITDEMKEKEKEHQALIDADEKERSSSNNY